MGEDPGAVGTRALDESGVPQQATTGDVPAAAPARQTPETPAELRAEIERTRQDLGDTVAALAEKTDVKARARDKVAEVKSTVTEKRTELMGRARESSPDGATSAATQVKMKAQQNPVPTAALAAFVGGYLFGRITRRR
jgi:chromosome segregation ATPase